MDTAEAHRPERENDPVTRDVRGDDHPALSQRPKLHNPFYHLIRVLQDGLERGITALDLPPGSRVLDYGCMTMRYRHLFPTDIEYIGADLPGNPAAEVTLGDQGRVPLPAQSFDVVFSTQVLEHVEDPDLYLAECRRLIKPDGRVLLTTHGTLIYHPCPNDFWRWTHMGLQRIFEKAGLQVTDIQGLCGGVPTALQLLQDTLSYKLPGFLRPVLHCVIQSLMVVADRLYSPQGKIRNAAVYMVTAAPTENVQTVSRKRLIGESNGIATN